MGLVHDILLVEQDNGLKFPEWVDLVGFGALDAIRKRGQASGVETPFLKRIAGGPLATHLVDKLTQKMNGTVTQSLQIYSAHDANIINLMSVLGMADQVGYLIDFAATAVFELHRINGCPVVKVSGPIS